MQYMRNKALQPKITSIRRTFNVALGAHQNTSAAECSFHMWEVSNIIAKVGSLMCFWGFFYCVTRTIQLPPHTWIHYSYLKLRDSAVCNYCASKILPWVATTSENIIAPFLVWSSVFPSHWCFVPHWIYIHASELFCYVLNQFLKEGLTSKC